MVWTSKVINNLNETNMSTTLPKVTVQLPTEISYWGSEATTSDVERIHDNLESMISREFSDRAELVFERVENPRGNGVHSDDAEMAGELFQWMQDNWTSAL